jgi:hypothetical protein
MAPGLRQSAGLSAFMGLVMIHRCSLEQLGDAYDTLGSQT